MRFERVDWKQSTADRHRSGRSSAMGIDDRIQNAAEDLGGKAKETAGKMTDDERLEAEGKADQAKADLKNAAEDVKDAFKH
jgi:uncharacterized protein YjbJ (UPF0337 family)